MKLKGKKGRKQQEGVANMFYGHIDYIRTIDICMYIR